MSEKMREEFEEWAKKYSKDIRLERGNHGSYVSGITHSLYCAWVASRAAVVVELPEAYENDADGHWLIRRADVKKIIEALGLKVDP
ncbi:hypothetical protein [Pseudomonas corrugata]